MQPELKNMPFALSGRKTVCEQKSHFDMILMIFREVSRLKTACPHVGVYVADHAKLCLVCASLMCFLSSLNRKGVFVDQKSNKHGNTFQAEISTNQPEIPETQIWRKIENYIVMF